MREHFAALYLLYFVAVQGDTPVNAPAEEAASEIIALGNRQAARSGREVSSQTQHSESRGRILQTVADDSSAVETPGLHFVCSIPSEGVTCGVCAASTTESGRPVLLYNLSRTQHHMPLSLIKSADHRTKLFGFDLCADATWDAASTVESKLREVVNALESPTQPQPFNLSQCSDPTPGAWPPLPVEYSGDSAGALFTRRPLGAPTGRSGLIAAPRAACYCHPDNGGECAPLLPVVGALEGEGTVYDAAIASGAVRPDGSSVPPEEVNVPPGSLSWSGVDVLTVAVQRGSGGEQSAAEGDGESHSQEVTVFSFGSPAMGWDGGDWRDSGVLVPGTGAGGSRDLAGCFGRSGVTRRCAVVVVLSCDESAFVVVEDDGSGGAGTETDGGRVVRLDLGKPPVISDSIRDRDQRDACALVLNRMGFDINSDVQSVCLRVYAAEACLYQPCPNSCSAHGRCRSDGSCSCDQGWASVDCSAEASCMQSGGCSEFATCEWRQQQGGGQGGEETQIAVCDCRSGYRGNGRECFVDPREGFAGPGIPGRDGDGDVVALFVLVSVLSVAVGSALLCILCRPWIASRCPACGRILTACFGENGVSRGAGGRGQRGGSVLRGRRQVAAAGTAIEVESGTDSDDGKAAGGLREIAVDASQVEVGGGRDTRAGAAGLGIQAAAAAAV